MADNNKHDESSDSSHADGASTAYFTHCNPDSKHAQTMLKLRRHEYLAWKTAINLADDDYDLMLQEMIANSGFNSFKVSAIINAYYRMIDLPKLRALATSLWHIDLDRWIAIDRAMLKAGTVNARLFSIIDDLLVDYLTPTKPAQQMPSKRAISRRITREIELHDESVRDKTKKQKPSRPNYEVTDIPCVLRNENDTHEFRFETDAETAITVDAHIREHAKQAGISLRDATIELLLSKGQTNVTLNCYRASDVANAPLFVSTTTGGGVQTLLGDAADHLASQASKHYDMDATTNAVVAGYATTPTMRSAVVGRDGHCRFPGCTQPATNCQMDHVVEYDQGGPTTPTNLIALCQHHHNIKTDKRARPIFEPASGTIVWLFADGSWQSTEADGPLAPSNRRWVQTVAQKMNCHRKEQREQAQKEHQKQHRRQLQKQSKEQEGTGGDNNREQAFRELQVQNETQSIMTKTQEEQFWHDNVFRLEHAINNPNLHAIKIEACQEQLAMIRAAIVKLKENGPGSDADGSAHESAYDFNAHSGTSGNFEPNNGTSYNDTASGNSSTTNNDTDDEPPF
ncbi:HNH endonuclease signature motif containing protein [Corynebacterium sp.]|uniref:HNH endonuclease signature motif containing protein n=1 Tax=Corynebacterium sp. TaxID=1720 RepID=UPI0027B8F5C1|nr:HNH endonuclease signature motif containing protein [Corynebacterium sp.]